MRKIMSRIISVVLMVAMVFALSSCTIPELENDKRSVDDNGVSGLSILLNGHVEEERGTSPMVTPITFIYDDIMVAIQTEYINKIPNDSLGLYNLPSGYRYLVVYINFQNGSRSDMNVNTSQFQVYADNTLCDEKYILDDNIQSSATVSSGRDGKIMGFFAVPKDADKVEIEFEKGLLDETLKFEVQEKGKFTDEDSEYMEEALKKYKNGTLRDPEPTPVPEETPVKVNSATSDSFYHSSRGTDYTVDLTLDGNEKTSWQDGRDDDAIGDTLTYNFDAIEIYKVKIVNGNRKNNSSFSKNNRLARVTLTFLLEGEEVGSTEMSLKDDFSTNGDVLELEAAIKCDTVVITIDEVYAGSEFQDTGIAEVMFFPA